MHMVCPLALYLPDSHGIGVSDGSKHLKPPSHVVQIVTPVTLLYIPGGHGFAQVVPLSGQ